MLDVIVLIAMAVTALAFAVGLIVHSGIAQIPALIAAAALYMVMAASYLMVARTQRPSGGGGARLDDFEEALEIIDKDLQRIDRIEEEVSRVDLITDRVERLDQALSEFASTAPIGGLSRPEHFTQEFEEIHAKIEAVRGDLEGEAQNQREKMTADLRMLENLIKQLSHELIAASGPESAAATARAVAAPPRMPALDAEVEKIEPEADIEPEPETEPEPEPDPEPEPESPAPEEESLTVVAIEEEEILIEADQPLRGLDDDDAPLRGEQIEDLVADEKDEPAESPGFIKPAPAVPEPEIEVPAVAEKLESNPIDSGEMLEIMSQAIEAGRVDLYLQPTVTLPDRRPCYFEALTRIRTKTDSLILPGSYLPVAEGSGLIPLIDNVLLVKSVQTLRRLGPDSPIKGVFCNISVKTLLDPE
ncbi:MAG TPA: EAL domain-containing protein, partial [Methyloceanibacter sp.]|nr:EAL domain-containing protein [Methyloceanibacter sp.]